MLTFEEVAGMFAAKEVDFNAVEVDEKPLSFSSADGRGFAVSGGVAKAVVNAIHKLRSRKRGQGCQCTGT